MILETLYGMALILTGLACVAFLAVIAGFVGLGALAWAAGAWERARGRM